MSERHTRPSLEDRAVAVLRGLESQRITRPATARAFERALARVLEGTIVLGIIAAITFLVGPPNAEPTLLPEQQGREPPPGWAAATAYGTVTVAWFAYEVVQTALGRQTIGKRLMGLRVLAHDDGRPGFRRAGTRAAVWMAPLIVFMGAPDMGAASWLLLALMVPYAWIFFDRDGLMLHDRVSGTRTIRD